MTRVNRDLGLLLGVWLAVAVVATWLSWTGIGQRQFPDPDDVMRLMQVRDWIGGQSWFNVTQYRLNPPAGVPMHWSRLVDVPIAAVILLCRPFVGRDAAEAAALVFVPLLTLGIAMLLVQRIGLRLMTGRAALAAAVMVPFSLGGLKQMRPMRIDHHGWQIVLALTAVLAAIDQRPRRSGVISGVALAVWMNISIEGLPFAAALGGLFAWQWLRDAAASDRLKAYLAALALFSVLLFGLTHWPSTWLQQPRDVVTVAHLAAFATASVVSAAIVRPGVDPMGKRAVRLAVVGASALAMMFAVDPQWLRGPFGSLDPLVRRFWYERVDEGLPAWQIQWGESAVALAQPAVGLLGGWLALRRTPDDARRRWMIYVLLLLGLAVASVFVIRTATTASVVALPGTAFLCQLAFRRARALPALPTRAVATAAALSIMTPAYAAPLSLVSTDPRLERAVQSWNACLPKSEVEKLNALPVGTIAAPLDITPALVLMTRHRALATGHHRNLQGMRDVIALFLDPPSEGAAILARRDVDYVVFCPNAPESIRYAYRGPNGLAALIARGNVPEWLEPVPVPGLRRLKVWRVRKPLLGAAQNRAT